MTTADSLNISRDTDRNLVLLRSANSIPVLRETEKAVLLELEDASGRTREQWFPKSVLFMFPDPNPAFGDNLFALRSFIGRNHLWHWTAE